MKLKFRHSVWIVWRLLTSFCLKLLWRFCWFSILKLYAELLMIFSFCYCVCCRKCPFPRPDVIPYQPQGLYQWNFFNNGT